ncbi:MAG TPA: hypothetical protein VFP21_11070 [Solirubrobacterales bacterium]|nr:hypothetical protein [Solirubrobacterales bacterium]
MRAIGRWLRGAALFALKNADAFFAMAVAAAVIIALALGNPSTDVVDAAILGLLATVALALLRNRVGTDRLEALRQLAADAMTDRPYQVIHQTNEWDIRDKDHVKTRLSQQLRFTRNDVSTIEHSSQGEGVVESYSAKWRRSANSQWISAKKIHAMAIERGEKVIYSLEEEHCRGDMLDWCIEREAVGRFPRDHERVTLEAKAVSDHPRVMKIVWPTEREPKHVEIRFGDEPAKPLKPKRRKGRLEVEEKISFRKIGEEVAILWNW